ncbi:putative bifunctional diguanylate cyclase/phosphodiesterase [Roseiterribacter gracilis]|uniref:Two-component system response regulator n=1 Tax=Roseiterribacter gracilis TaxID=2812848 RepID=A0A8S8XC70_9PROT|nr:two-component system response regulator [Rhodospirillales bacterium TMPK1]
MNFQPSVAARPGRILVVDDNGDNRTVLTRRLERRGYGVSEAVDGASALLQVAAGGIELVLLDVNMPEMSGLEVLAELRRTYNPVELPVIMVTANSHGDDILRAIQADANDYVVKPVEFEPLLRRIETHLARRRVEAALRISEERFALALRGSMVGVWEWDRDSDAVYFAPGLKGLIGYAEDEGPSTFNDWLDLAHPDDRARLESVLLSADHELQSLLFEYRVRHSRGGYRWMRVRGNAYGVTRDDPGRVVGFQVDISDRKLVDPATGLPNRLQLLDALETALAAEPRLAVALINIDRFRLINESLGTQGGDALLKLVAERLQTAVRPTDLLTCLGGDEFALLARNVQTDGDMRDIVDGLQARFSSPIELDGHELHVSLRVGAVLAGPEHRLAGDLLHHADLAQRQAKLRPDARLAFAVTPTRGAALARLQLENQLHRAVARGEFVAVFQPIVALATGRTVGFEALARWHHPERGEIAPGGFIPVAEETGIIGAIDDCVLGIACREAATWSGAQFVTVNVSGRRFADPSLIAVIDAKLAAARLDPGRLKLEITESTIMTDAAAAANTVRSIAARGIGVAIDDFGTGYSSLAYLHRFDANTLKIDSSFVKAMSASEQGMEIARTIVMLARNLRMSVVAEGVETEAQRNTLLSLGCEYGQGYYFARPLSAEAARDLVSREAA